MKDVIGCSRSTIRRELKRGSVSEAIETIKLARANCYTTQISHHSGETGNTYTADFYLSLTNTNNKIYINVQSFI